MNKSPFERSHHTRFSIDYKLKNRFETKILQMYLLDGHVPNLNIQLELVDDCVSCTTGHGFSSYLIQFVYCTDPCKVPENNHGFDHYQLVSELCFSLSTISEIE